MSITITKPNFLCVIYVFGVHKAESRKCLRMSISDVYDIDTQNHGYCLCFLACNSLTCIQLSIYPLSYVIILFKFHPCYLNICDKFMFNLLIRFCSDNSQIAPFSFSIDIVFHLSLSSVLFCFLQGSCNEHKVYT